MAEYKEHEYIEFVRNIVEQEEEGQVEKDVRPELIVKVAYYLTLNDVGLEESFSDQIYQMYDLLRVMDDTVYEEIRLSMRTE